jgi:hypothetical protein
MRMPHRDGARVLPCRTPRQLRTHRGAPIPISAYTPSVLIGAPKNTSRRRARTPICRSAPSGIKQRSNATRLTPTLSPHAFSAQTRLTQTDRTPSPAPAPSPPTTDSDQQAPHHSTTHSPSTSNWPLHRAPSADPSPPRTHTRDSAPHPHTRTTRLTSPHGTHPPRPSIFPPQD